MATAEGTWAAIGLLESFRQEGREVSRGRSTWHGYSSTKIGFQRHEDELAINYFTNLGLFRVPDNSITVLRFLAEFWQM